MEIKTISINEKYRIDIDYYQYILKERMTKENGEDDWQTRGYFTQIETLLKSLLTKSTNRTNAVTIQQYIDNMTAIKDDLIKQIKRAEVLSNVNVKNAMPVGVEATIDSREGTTGQLQGEAGNMHDGRMEAKI